MASLAYLAGAPVPLTVLAAALGLVALLTALWGTGRSPGLLVAGGLAVDPVTGVPRGVRPGPVLLCDVRGGPDPRGPLTSPRAFGTTSGTPVSEPASPGSAGGTPPATAVRLLIYVDGRARGSMGGSTTLGRLPVGRPGDHLITLTDLGRNVSKDHVRLTLQDGVVVATDQNTTNGTTMRLADGRVFALGRGTAHAVPADATLLVGSHTISIQAPRAVDEPEEIHE